MSPPFNCQNNPSSPPLNKGPLRCEARRLGGVWDVIFPPRCLNCRRFGSWVCQDCWDKIELIVTPVCYQCNRLSEGFKICPACRRNLWLHRLLVCSYWQSPLKELVYGLKYHRVRPIVNNLGGLLVKIASPFCGDEDIMIAPVPLHRGRLWDRGFNQAELLAKIVAEGLKRPLVFPLIRRKFTRPQFSLNKSERKNNVATAFAVATAEKRRIHNKIVILVDDIITTGATLNACAKILKQNGAREVWGLVLAKA